jgi:hypothetical protein
MADVFPGPIRVALNGHYERVVWFRGWEFENTTVGRAIARFSLTDLSGTGCFDIATGFGTSKGLEEWRLTPESQAELIAWAKTQRREIVPRERRTRSRRAKRKPKVSKKQTEMF